MKPQIYVAGTYDGNDTDAMLHTFDSNYKRLRTIDKAAKAKGQLLYRFISHPYADGNAFYQIVKETKKNVTIKVC